MKASYLQSASMELDRVDTPHADIADAAWRSVYRVGGVTAVLAVVTNCCRMRYFNGSFGG